MKQDILIVILNRKTQTDVFLKAVSTGNLISKHKSVGDAKDYAEEEGFKITEVVKIRKD